jgi:acyl carrier protein
MWDDQFEAILRRHLPFLPPEESLGESIGLRDFGLDSMATVELLADLESTYRVRFLNDLLRMETFATPGVLWASLTALRETAR